MLPWAVCKNVFLPRLDMISLIIRKTSGNWKVIKGIQYFNFAFNQVFLTIASVCSHDWSLIQLPALRMLLFHSIRWCCQCLITERIFQAKETWHEEYVQMMIKLSNVWFNRIQLYSHICFFIFFVFFYIKIYWSVLYFERIFIFILNHACFCSIIGHLENMGCFFF